jgi:hypothetical protein
VWIPRRCFARSSRLGSCDKGSKCKFSHDVNVGRKVEKKNLYEDDREEKMKGEHRSFYHYEVSYNLSM